MFCQNCKSDLSIFRFCNVMNILTIDRAIDGFNISKLPFGCVWNVFLNKSACNIFNETFLNFTKSKSTEYNNRHHCINVFDDCIEHWKIERRFKGAERQVLLHFTENETFIKYLNHFLLLESTYRNIFPMFQRDSLNLHQCFPVAQTLTFFFLKSGDKMTLHLHLKCLNVLQKIFRSDIFFFVFSHPHSTFVVWQNVSTFIRTGSVICRNFVKFTPELESLITQHYMFWIALAPTNR